MKKKVLIVATVGRFLNFEKLNMEILKEMGYEIHCASNFFLEKIDKMEDLDVVKHQVDFARSPFSLNTIKAYSQIKKILSMQQYELIHCHTPVGGILTRCAARKYRKGNTKVFYTAHGFHFYKGAPILNWLLFYPVEWLCSWWTDVLITINLEDYDRAKRLFKAVNTKYVPGVGIDLEKYKSGIINKNSKRESLGIEGNQKMLLSVGELSTRKNHEIVIQAIGKLKDSNVKYFICGTGPLKDKLEQLIHLKGLDKQVFLLGYRNDISELCQSADLFVFPSLQEGLPVALMEAMACNVPVVCSNIRGNIDLVENEKCMFDPFNADEVRDCIKSALSNNSIVNNSNIIKKFGKSNVCKIMKDIYRKYI